MLCDIVLLALGSDQEGTGRYILSWITTPSQSTLWLRLIGI